MRQFWKWLSVFIGAVVLAFIVAIVVLTVWVNPDQFKPLIISEFKKETGIDVQIPGKLSWSFFPYLGVEVDELILSKPSQLHATIDDLILRVKFAPLFHQRLEFSKASIRQLQLNQWQASDIKARIHVENQELFLHPLTAIFYQGRLRSDIHISLTQAAPVIQLTAALQDVDMKSLIQGLSGGKASKLVFEGRANLSADLNSQGKTKDELIKQLNGKGRLSIEKGVMQGIDIGYFVDTATALIEKQPLPTRLPQNQTEFGEMTGTADIKNGILYNQDLLLKSTLYTVKGVGSINLQAKTLDYHLEVTLNIGESKNKILALAGKSVPIRVSGSLSSPTASLDTLALMQEIGKEQLQKVQEKIQKALPDKANKFLQNLFH